MPVSPDWDSLRALSQQRSSSPDLGLGVGLQQGSSPVGLTQVCSAQWNQRLWPEGTRVAAGNTCRCLHEQRWEARRTSQLRAPGASPCPTPAYGPQRAPHWGTDVSVAYKEVDAPTVLHGLGEAEAAQRVRRNQSSGPETFSFPPQSSGKAPCRMGPGKRSSISGGFTGAPG